MKDTTLCLLVNGDKILLAMKKRGFGAGRWNGCGGKLLAGETVIDAVVRELKEEIEITADPGMLTKVGELLFYFKHKPEWDQRVNIFTLREWDGEPKETEEMRPRWFSFGEIPYHDMWPDDKYWLPKVLAGKNVSGEFHFKDDGNEFEKFTVNESSEPEPA